MRRRIKDINLPLSPKQRALRENALATVIKRMEHLKLSMDVLETERDLLQFVLAEDKAIREKASGGLLHDQAGL